MSKQFEILSKVFSAIGATTHNKWEHIQSESEKKAWRRKKSDGSWEYRYQDSDPNKENEHQKPVEEKDEHKSTAITEKDVKSVQNSIDKIDENHSYVYIPETAKTFDISEIRPDIKDAKGVYIAGFQIVRSYPHGLLQVKNEVLASKLYQSSKYGTAPTVFMSVYEGQPVSVSVSEYLTGADPKPFLSAEKKNFVLNVFLGNLDLSKTLSYKNYTVWHHNLANTLLFDSNGNLKPDEEPNDVVSDMKAMNTSSDELSKKLSEEVGEEEILRQIVNLAHRFTPEYLRGVVHNVFDQEPELADKIIQRLLQRKNDLVAWAKQVARAKVSQKVLKRKERYNIGPVQIKKPLTDEETSAIKNYTNMYYRPMNQYLREGTEEISDVGKVKKSIEDVVQGLKKLPVWTKPCYRGIDLDEHSLIVLSEMKAGDVLYMKAFSSTSKKKSLTFDMQVQFTIHGKTGRDVEKLSRHPEEKEVLFAPDSRFMVKSVQHEGWHINVEIEEILPDEMKNKKPVNLTKKKLTASDIRAFLLKNSKLTPKQRQRIQTLSEADLFKIIKAIFANSSKGKEAEDSQEGGNGKVSDKFTEIFI